MLRCCGMRARWVAMWGILLLPDDTINIHFLEAVHGRQDLVYLTEPSLRPQALLCYLKNVFFELTLFIYLLFSFSVIFSSSFLYPVLLRHSPGCSLARSSTWFTPAPFLDNFASTLHHLEEPQKRLILPSEAATMCRTSQAAVLVLLLIRRYFAHYIYLNVK